MTTSPPDDDRIPAGAKVEVANLFVGGWSGGFEVATGTAGGYALRRLSDGTVLPAVIPIARVRPAARTPADPTPYSPR